MSRKLRINRDPGHARKPGGSAEALLGAIVVGIVTFAVFWPTANNEFVAWDDDKTITENERFRGLSSEHLTWMFTTFHTGHWQPLSWITLAINAEISQILYDDPVNPRPYHLTNNLLHAFNAVLFYLLALRLLAIAMGSGTREQGPTGASLAIASAVAALLFAVHPLRVESVAWATERRDVLSACFFLATLLAYVKSVAPREAPGVGRSRRWYIVALVMAVLCMLSKSIGVVLPAIMLLLDVYPLRRLSIKPREWMSAATLHVVAEKTPFIILAIAGSVVAVSAQRTAGAMFADNQLGLDQRLYVMMHGFAEYVITTFFPWKLSPLNEIPYQISLRDRSFILSSTVVTAITITALMCVRRFPAVLVAWCAYLLIVLPVSGLFQSGPQLMADRYSYLSCMGLALLGGGAMLAFLAKPNDVPTGRRGFFLACLVASGIIVALGVLTVRQIAVWRDTMTLWTTVIERRPGTAMAYMNRGVEYEKRQDLPRAQLDLEKAVGFWPTDPHALQILANVLASRGDFVNSEHYARRAVESDPNMVKARLDLGFALLQLNRVDEALQQYRTSFKLDAGTWPTIAALINHLMAQGKRSQAIQLASNAAQDRPENAEAVALLQRLKSQ